MGNLCGGEKDDIVYDNVGFISEEEVGKSHKLLLLGAGESGKSTVSKQVKIIHLDGFTEKEKRDFRTSIYRNIMECIQRLVEAVDTFEIDFDSEENYNAAEEIMDMELEEVPDMKDTIKKLWHDSGVQKAYARRNEFQLFDSAAYLLNKIDEVTKEDYEATIEDILITRTMTTGIVESHFEYKGESFDLYDVGGQRNERKKWINLFKDVAGVLFCASTAVYDMVLYEDENRNRMEEALLLFEEISNSRWFVDSQIFLVLTKVDQLEEKLKVRDLSVFFEDYTGGSDLNAAKEFLRKKYASLYRGDPESLTITFVNALVTKDIEVLFDAVADAFRKQ